MQDKTFDVGAFIDNQRVSAVQLLVMLLCAAIMTVDGYDVFVMGFLLQPIAQSFGVPPAAITSVFVVQSVGLALGTWVVSPLADRYGRRRLLLASAVLFGAFTLATTQARTVNELVALRFAAGLFYGSLIPNAIAITVEYAPERLRATMVNWMFIGYTAGAASGGAVAAFLVGKYGWQSAFWVGGLTPLGFAVILYFALPESIRFCVLRNERDPRIPGLLRRIDPALALTGSERFVLDEPAANGTPVAALFRDGRAAITVLIWLAYFMNILVITVLGAFLPTFLRNFGALSLEHAAGITSFYSISGIAAMLIYGRLIDLYGAPRVITLTSIVAAAAVASLGLIDLQSPGLYVATFFVGTGVIAGQGGLHALSSMTYPTRMRATGVGWAVGAGRVGGMLGPLLGGAALAGRWEAFPTFLAAGLPMLLVAIATFLIGLIPAPADLRHPEIRPDSPQATRRIRAWFSASRADLTSSGRRS
jgi:AAHS family 4-hydroxybenzoate transporter-like MFS transporter